MEEKTYVISGYKFSERDVRLIENCITYYENDPAGLPGHALIIIVAKLADIAHLRSFMDFAFLDEDEWR